MSVLVLSLSTSTPRASVAITLGDRVLAELSRDEPREHAEQLFSLIDGAVSLAGCARSDIGLVACDVGPGSFTGVRIAVASAKGIAAGLGVPLMGVVSLEAMAANARAVSPQHALVVAAIDAKKGELYVAAYDGENVLLPPSHLAHADVGPRLLEIVSTRAFVSIVDAEAFADFAPGAAQRITLHPSAAWVGRLASGRFAAAGALARAEVVPLYVRAPDAVPIAGNFGDPGRV